MIELSAFCTISSVMEIAALPGIWVFNDETWGADIGRLKGCTQTYRIFRFDSIKQRFNSGKYKALQEQTRYLGVIRSEVWQRFGSIRGVGSRYGRGESMCES